MPFQHKLITALALTALLAFAQPVVFAEDLPTGAEIMDRITEATGGTEAIAGIESAVTRGTMKMEAMGISGSITTWSKKPGMVRASIELAALGKIERGAVDGVAWEFSPLMGPRIMDGTERDFMLLESDLGWSADWRDHYENVECTGEEEVNGVDCYLLTLTFKGEHEMKMAVNKETNLPATMDMTMEVQGSAIPIEILYDSYDTFGDLTLPTKVTQNVLTNTVSVTFEAYEFNVEIPDERFALPEEVKAILPTEDAGGDAPEEEADDDAEEETDDESTADATDSDA